MIPTSRNKANPVIIQKYYTKLTLDLDNNEMIIEKVALIPFWGPGPKIVKTRIEDDAMRKKPGF